MPADFTITQSDTIALAQDGWSVPVTFQQLDPSQGTLISAGLSLTGTVAGIAAVENLGVAAATVPISTAGTIMLNAGTVDVDSATVVASGSVTLGAYNGAIDFQGPSGKIAVFTNSSPGTLAGNSGSLSAFVGTGTIGYTATSYAQVTEITNGNILSVTRGEAGATIDLRYVAGEPGGGGSGSDGSVLTLGGITTPYTSPVGTFQTETTFPQIFRVADATTGWDHSFSLNQFDPSLGTLEEVSVTVVSNLNARLALENLGSVAGTAALTDEGGLSLILPGMNAFNVGGPMWSANTTLQAFDGAVDFAGASGTLVSGLSVASITETIQQSLSSYIGNGAATIDLRSFSPALLTGPADLAAELLTNAGAMLEVSYIYNPGTPPTATETLAISDTQPNLTTVEQTMVQLFAGVTITDPAARQTETVTVRVSNPANGVLELDLPTGSFSDRGYDAAAGVLTIIDSADQVTAALEGLAFVPAATISAGQSITTEFTISVTDTAGITVTDTTTSVTEIPGVQIDTVAAAAAVQTALADTEALPIPCFTAGTRIATPSGPVAVENLREGDLVLTEAGTRRPIVWIGRRTVDCHRHPAPDRVRPIRIARHAFGMNRPCRALTLSPDHAVYTDEVLIPVKFLLNDSTVTQAKVARVTYFHLELPAHGVVLAENLPCESYLETGGRNGFENAGPALALHPDFAGSDPERVGTIWQTQACAPLIRSETILQRVQARLAFQALMLQGQSRRRSTRSGSSGALEISDTIAQ